MIGKKFLTLTVAAVVIVVVVLAVSFHPYITNVESVGEKYNASVSYWTDHTQLTYTDETGTHNSSYFDEQMKPGLDWIKSNTPQNATFLCWWDYGHMIKAVGERDVVVRNPSQEILDSIADPSGIKEYDPNDKIQDVAAAFATTNQTETAEMMAKYNATYIMLRNDDAVKSTWFFRISGLNYSDYVVNDDSNFHYTDLGENTMIARLLDNRDTGFTLVYQDQQMKIYKLT